MSPDPIADPPHVSFQVFLDGIIAAVRSVFFYVLVGNYVGMGALAHEVGFSFWWMALSTAAGLGGAGTGHPGLDADHGVAVGGGAGGDAVERPLPADGGGDPAGDAAAGRSPARSAAADASHRDQRLGRGHAAVAADAGRAPHRLLQRAGHRADVGGASSAARSASVLAARLPPLFAAALLFFTPMAILMSSARNSRTLLDGLAFALGLVVGPIVAAQKIGLDLMWTGLIAGTMAYVGPPLARGKARAHDMSAPDAPCTTRTGAGADPGRLPAERGLAAGRADAGARPRREVADHRLGAGGRDRHAGRRAGATDPVDLRGAVGDSGQRCGSARPCSALSPS